MNRTIVFYVILFLAAMVAPVVLYPFLLMELLCFALFASAFNLLLGYAGLLSFGHAAFFGMAAYISSILMRDYGWPIEFGLLASILGSALLGLVFGWIAIRRSGIYFAMITLALAQAVYFLAVQGSGITGGDDGLHGVPRGKFFGLLDLSEPLILYYFVLALFIGAFWLIQRIVHSPFGLILKAVRDNEPRAISLGYDVGRYKLLVFVLSAALAGLAGSLKSIVFQLASLSDVHWHTSGEVILMTLLGGVGTIFGPLVGAGIVVMFKHSLAQGILAESLPIVMGFLFVVCVLVFRRGVVGEAHAFLKSRSSNGIKRDVPPNRRR
ncbi:branched-chain amino acid ABC transporter permease [Marinobacter changyiensis]|uniref:branched-chain amino acid ABC transporter permease n=1 Tax=Marinobacter changyiensis TaxID=2604091 RepID=UPI0012643C2D|nr:branched-chain amino acid ABC transporter permease [Marinobacter changyiensis]